MRVSRGPLIPADGPAGARLARRARGIAIELGAFALLTSLSPLVLAGALVVDAALWVLQRRKPWMAVRLAAMAWWFLFGELQGMVALAGIYLVTGGPFGRGSAARPRAVLRLRLPPRRSHLGGGGARVG